MAVRRETPRFAFGRNWRGFVAEVDEERIRSAIESLRRMLGVEDLRGRTFLDVGCGSGLFSLAAARLGADRIHSFDYDADSVTATDTLRSRYAPDANWSVERGDATDEPYMRSLGTFDVVYSWGVLHHTGAMWVAVANTSELVAPGGQLFIALYNDQGRKSELWRAVKRTFNRLPAPVQPVYAVVVMLPYELRLIAGALARKDPLSYVQGWTQPLTRGMSRWHDLLDWAGGYPFEVATPHEVFGFLHARGFDLEELVTAGGSLGCNEFVFRRIRPRHD